MIATDIQNVVSITIGSIDETQISGHVERREIIIKTTQGDFQLTLYGVEDDSLVVRV